MEGTMTKSVWPSKILLIEMIRPASIGFARHSPKTGSSSFDVEWVRQLSEGLARLSQGGIDAVLLELSLPDSHGIETFDKLFSVAPDVPILVLGNGNEALAKEAVGRGAQDYLLGGTSTAIRYHAHCAMRSNARPSRMHCT